MSFVWDKKKERKNLRRHEVSFDEASTVFDDPFFLIAADDDHSFDEKRFVILGKSHTGRLLVVAYAERDQDTRIISARDATRKERKNYEEEI
jgi:uncharacterized DUF497 family protein